MFSLHQSPLYQNYIKALKWQVLIIDGVAIYYRKLPFIGSLAKIQRPQQLPFLPKLIPLLQSLHIKTIAVEPESNQNELEYQKYMQSLGKFFRLYPAPFLQTKTILIDLTAGEETIFKRFSEAKQRAIRRAQKNNVVIEQSNDIHKLINVKAKSAGLFGGITTYGLTQLWQSFYPDNAAILLSRSQPTTYNSQPVAGILLLFYDQSAYYWIAGATKQGKKLFAPTLLVWEALKIAKQKGAEQFDFVGVFDERKPHENKSWKGFTKFKEGFGGTSLYYPRFISMPHI